MRVIIEVGVVVGERKERMLGRVVVIVYFVRVDVVLVVFVTVVEFCFKGHQPRYQAASTASTAP